MTFAPSQRTYTIGMPARRAGKTLARSLMCTCCYGSGTQRVHARHLLKDDRISQCPNCDGHGRLDWRTSLS